MPVLSPGSYDTASQTTLNAVKAKTDNIGATVALESGGNLAAIKVNTDVLPGIRWDCITNIPKYFSLAGTWSNTTDLNEYIGAYLGNTGAINDAISFSFWANSLSPMTLYARGRRGGDRGISSIYVDGVLQGTMDWYVAGADYNYINSLSITPARIGLNVLKFLMASKNALGTSYYLSITEIWTA